MVLAKYAIQACNGIDALGLTWTDLELAPGIATKYRFEDREVTELRREDATSEFVEKCHPLYSRVKSFPHFKHMLEEHLQVPIELYSHGRTAEDKLWKPSLLGL
jgi:hypothetical protein